MVYYGFTDMTADGSKIELGLGGRVQGQPYISLESSSANEDGVIQVFLDLTDATTLANALLNGVREARKSTYVEAEEVN